MKIDRAQMFNILRGVVMACALPNPRKRVLCQFITELEEQEAQSSEKSKI